MIKQVIRLVRPGLFLPCFEVENPAPEDILIRPRYLSICAADQRYFQGNRPPEVLEKKLPLALFHEAVGEVLHDPSGELLPGTFCVMLPGGMESAEDKSNYKRGAFFRSSNADGFCQEVMSLKRGELIPVCGEPAWFYVFTELVSVCCQALRRLEDVTRLTDSTRIGIWGDGSMAFVMALTAAHLKPRCPLYVFGKHDDKLLNFSFADRQINIADRRDHTSVDVAVECVGGAGAQSAIAQAVDRLSPTGFLLLMGVSETPPNVPTRLILEKGLTVLGSSRSTRRDFECAVRLIDKAGFKNSLLKIVSAQKSFSTASELIDIFNEDKHLPYKIELEIKL